MNRLKGICMARIKVKHVALGTHNWPGAEEHFPEVGFLKHEHHHDFHIYVECDVEQITPYH